MCLSLGIKKEVNKWLISIHYEHENTINLKTFNKWIIIYQ